MSFSPDFAPDAQAKWKQLDPDLQEQVLDAIEDALVTPPPPDPSDPKGVETRILIHHDVAPDMTRVLEVRIGWIAAVGYV